MSDAFMTSPTEVIKVGEPLSNSDEIRQAFEKGEIYKRGFEDARKRFERPKGEWKITEAYPHKVYCGECYKTYAQENWKVWKDGSLPRHFCPNCGADMRKGDEE